MYGTYMGYIWDIYGISPLQVQYDYSTDTEQQRVSSIKHRALSIEGG
jgi:hypothetical protein